MGCSSDAIYKIISRLWKEVPYENNMNNEAGYG